MPKAAPVPALNPDRSLVIEVPFAEAGDTILGIAIPDMEPIAITLRIPIAGTYRLSIEMEKKMSI